METLWLNGSQFSGIKFSIEKSSKCLSAITHFVGKLQTFIPLLNIPLKFVPFHSCYILLFRAARQEFRRYYFEIQKQIFLPFFPHPISTGKYSVHCCCMKSSPGTAGYWYIGWDFLIASSLLFRIHSYILQLDNFTTLFPCLDNLKCCAYSYCEARNLRSYFHRKMEFLHTFRARRRDNFLPSACQALLEVMTDCKRECGDWCWLS